MQDPGRGAPDRVAVGHLVGVPAVDVVADLPLHERLGRVQRREIVPEHLGDLAVVGDERRRADDEADERHDQDRRDERVHRRQRAEHLDVDGRQAKLLVRLAQRGRGEVAVLGVLQAAGERDLARMPREVGGSTREHQRPVGHDRHEHAGQPVLGARRGRRCRVQGRREAVAEVARVHSMAMVEERAVSAAVDAVDPEELLRFATALIAAPSENPGGTEDEAAAVAGEILDGLGAAPEVVRGDAGRPSVVARVGATTGPRLAWNGHLDVVPAGDPTTWEHPPFAGEVVSGLLVGRGAADMKGPIASALAAAAAIRRAGVDLGGAVEFHLAADEELAGIHGTRVLWERGLLDQDACIVGEPSELHIGLAERGGAWITATAKGKAAHGSQPERGVNAITSMARFLLRIEEVLPDREHDLVGRPSVNAALISGGSAPNVVPDRCEVDIDRRVIPGETDPAEVIAPFERLADAIRADHPELDLTFRVREWTDAAEADPESDIAAICRDAVREQTGHAPKDVGFTGITDARFYINEAEIPTVILGPGSLSVAHTANEWVAVDDLVAAARVYAAVFVRFLGT